MFLPCFTGIITIYYYYYYLISKRRLIIIMFRYFELSCMYITENGTDRFDGVKSKVLLLFYYYCYYYYSRFTEVSYFYNSFLSCAVNVPSQHFRLNNTSYG